MRGPCSGELRSTRRCAGAGSTTAKWRSVSSGYGAAAGLTPRQVQELGGQSLRAGFVTAALQNGADPLRVMDITGHVGLDTLKKYARDANRFREHAWWGLL